jgi:hypothetical protein
MRQWHHDNEAVYAGYAKQQSRQQYGQQTGGGVYTKGMGSIGTNLQEGYNYEHGGGGCEHEYEQSEAM